MSARDDKFDRRAGCLAGLILIVPLALYTAWVAHLLWRWFVVPLGAPEIGMAHVYGLMLLVRLTTYQGSDVATEKGEVLQGVVTKAIEGVFFATLCLLIGWWLS